MAAGTEITQPVSFTERASGTGPAAACCGKARVGSIQLRCFRGSTESFALLSANGKDLVIPEEPEEPDFVADSGSERGAETATSAMQSKPPRFTRTLFEESLSMKSSSNSAESLFLEDSCRVQLEAPSVSQPVEAPARLAMFPGEARMVVRSGGWTDIGSRSCMEDAHVLLDDLTGCLGKVRLASPCAFYGVFDGHGGHTAAHFVSEHLLRHIVEDPAFPEQMAAACRGGYERTDNALGEQWAAGSHRQEFDSGTTALTVLVCGNSLVVANAGDCRAVLSRRGKAVDLSEDQKPALPSEKARIEAAGGFVVDNYLNGQLGVARALGDWHLKVRDPSKNPLTSEPEVREATLSPEDEFMILGCDGLWDVVSSQNAVDYARKHLQLHNDPEKCSKALVTEALRRHTTDNLTVVTVCFGVDPPPPLAKPWRPGVRRSISVDGLLSVQSCIDRS